MAADILIVDDEESITQALSMVLNDEGHHTRTASNGAEATELLNQEPADLIVSDVMMPVVDGVTFVRHLRRRGDETPVVLMSAAPGSYRDLPGVRELPKPFDLDVLLLTVETSLNEK